jgi:enoyl-CoA hydratase/carnithine racemase
LGLVAACHYRICAKGTVFENNVIDRIAPPGSAAVWLLTRLLGKAQAWELLLEGTSLSADEARALKLVNAVLPNESFEADAIALAETFAAKPRQGIRSLVVAFNHSSLPIADYLKEAGAGFDNIYKED